MSSIGRAVSQKLSAYIHEEKINVSELSRRVGITQQSLAAIMAGKTKNPSGECLLALAKVVGCSVEYLCGATDKNSGFSEPFVHFNETYNSGLWLKSVEAADKVYKKYANAGLVDGKTVRNFASEIYNYAMTVAHAEGGTPKIDKNYVKHRASMIDASFK